MPLKEKVPRLHRADGPDGIEHGPLARSGRRRDRHRGGGFVEVDLRRQVIRDHGCLKIGGGRLHVPDDPFHHRKDFHVLGGQVVREGCREGRGLAAPVIGDLSGRGGEDDHRAVMGLAHRGEAAGRDRAGVGLGLSVEGARQRIVAAGIDEDEGRAAVALQLRDDEVKVDGLRVDVELAFELCIRSEKVVPVLELHAVAREVEERDIRALGLPQEGDEFRTDIPPGEVEVLSDIEAEIRERCGDEIGVADRVSEGGRMFVVRIPDHERHALSREGGCRQQRECEQDVCDPCHVPPPRQVRCRA